MRDSKRDTDVKNRLLDFVGEDKGGMIWETSIETCILPGTLMQIFYINLLKTSTDVPLHLGHISNIITWFTRSWMTRILPNPPTSFWATFLLFPATLTFPQVQLTLSYLRSQIHVTPPHSLALMPLPRRALSWASQSKVGPLFFLDTFHKS